MISDGVIRSTCDLCARGCGVLIHMENGKPVRIEGDSESPVNKGALCIKGLASLEYLYHPDRLKYPLKRAGQRGEDKWQQISWDEALDTITDELIKARDNHGAESVAFIHGGAKGFGDSYLGRLAYVFGSPNVAWQGHVCAIPRGLASQITFGGGLTPDYEHPPACVIVWGSNTAATLIYRYNSLVDAINKGAKLIVIDPRDIGLVQRANLWLKVRPGSDLALALGMINVIVNENLYDQAFVDKWAVGFAELKAHVQSYPPEKVEEITWIDAEKIREAARFYATNKPACIEDGNGLDQNVNSFQVARAITILRAITGNLGVPGGEVSSSPIPLVRRKSPELELWDRLPAETWQRRVDAELKLLPLIRYVTPQSIIKAISEEEPYPIRVAYIQGCNSLITHSNAQYTHEAFNKLDFLVVADMFMTPTAAMADIVLPAASYLEYDSISATGGPQVQQKVAQIAECRSNYETLNGLARKLGLGEYFWDTEQQCLDAILKPTEITFEELRKIGSISGTKQYRKYEDNGFETPSRKVEIYSNRLKEWGFDPLPVYYEPPETPYSEPGLAQEYPLILTTWKSAAYRHGGGRQIATLRRSHPEPVVSIHPETASKLEINDGDWVYIETRRGKIKQKAVLSTKIDPRVVIADYGWWFPEKDASELYGWSESNISILTDNKPPYSREMGSTNLRGILCKVYKA